MNRARPNDLRIALQCAQTFVNSGIDFVCIPIIDNDDKHKLRTQADAAIEKLIELTEHEEKIFNDEHPRP